MPFMYVRYLGLASFAAGMFFFGSSPGDPKAIIAVLAGLSAIIVSDAKLFADASRKKSDRALLKQFLIDLPSSGTIAALKRHDWCGKIHDSKLSQLDDYVNKWPVPEYEFLDPALRARQKRLHERMGEFLQYFAHNTHPNNRRVEYQEVPPEWELEQPERYRQTVRELTRLSDAIIETHADLIRTGRDLLGDDDPA